MAEIISHNQNNSRGILNLLKGLLNHKALARIFSVLLAFALWLHISTRDVKEEALSVPLDLVNFPANMVVADNLPEGISLRVRGPAALTRFVVERKPRFRIDLSGAHRGANSFTLSAGSLGLPRGVTVSRMIPPTVTVTLEPVETRLVPLRLVLTGEPDPGFFLEEAAVEPRYVTLRGPANLLAQVDYLETNPININGTRHSLVQKVAPVFSDHGLSLIDNPSLVAHIKISEISETAIVRNVLIEADEGFEVAGVVAVTISGPASVVKQITADDLTVKAVWPPQTPPEGRLRVDLDITKSPRNIEILKITPAQARLTALKPGPETEAPVSVPNEPQAPPAANGAQAAGGLLDASGEPASDNHSPPDKVNGSAEGRQPPAASISAF